MTNPKFDRTLTVRGAANYLGLSASTLNKLRCTGAGPVYFKLGRAVRYDPGDLDEWLAAHRVANTSEATARLCAQKIGGYPETRPADWHLPRLRAAHLSTDVASEIVRGRWQFDCPIQVRGGTPRRDVAAQPQL